MHQALDVSAIAHFEIDGKPYLAIGSDESKQKVQLLQQTSEQVYAIQDTLEISLPVADNPDKIDIESIAFDYKDSCLYIAGSYSKKRKTVKVDKKTAAENRERLTDIKSEKDRRQLFKVSLESQSGHVVGAIEKSKDLREFFAEDDYLRELVDLPSKENGIDIEGLAISNGQLFLGFRGPVLRGNYVPVMVTQFDNLEDYELRFVQLNGNGIRDITAVEDGFLIIAGPMGDAPAPYQLCFWDGTDMVYGTDRRPPMPPALVYLEAITPPIGADGTQGKAEGITVLAETAVAYTVLIVYDNLLNGSPQLWHLHKQSY